MNEHLTEDVKKIAAQSDMLYKKLTADLTRDVSSPEIQLIVEEILQFIQKYSTDVSFDKPILNVLMDSYSNDYVKHITDAKFGKGASEYIVKAFSDYSRKTTL